MTCTGHWPLIQPPVPSSLRTGCGAGSSNPRFLVGPWQLAPSLGTFPESPHSHSEGSHYHRKSQGF